MPEITLIDEQTRIIDLGNSSKLTVINVGLKAVEIYIDLPDGSDSAIKGSTGNPFTLQRGGSTEVEKTDLETEHVRLGVKGDGAKVTFRF